MFGFHALSQAPISDLVGDIKTGNVSLSSNVTISASVSAAWTASSSIETDTAVTSSGVVLKLGQARLASSGPFDNGFAYGFEQDGVIFRANGSIYQNHLLSRSIITANATLLRHPDPLGLASLQSQTNFTGKSVLLHRVRADFNLSGGSRFDSAFLTSGFEEADNVLLTLYIDKLIEMSTHVNKEKLFTLYSDKSLDSSLYIDKDLSSGKYIDKTLEQVLVREK